jgi:hypothetical protein
VDKSFSALSRLTSLRAKQVEPLFDMAGYRVMDQGCQIFHFTTYQNGQNIPKDHQITIKIPNGHKIYKMAIQYTKWPYNKQNGHKIYQKFSTPK